MNLLEAIDARHSVRAYKMDPIQEDTRERLDAFVSECNREGNLHISIRYDDPAGFDSRLAHYGSFRNVRNYIVLAGENGSDFDCRCGYYGEKIVLFAQQLGLNTCWVGLSYTKVPGTYVLDEDEKIVCYIAIGYGETQGVGHKIKTVEQVSRSAVRTLGSSTVACDITPSWFRQGVEAALLAPTAVNQQKFSFEYLGMKDGRHQVRAKKGFSLIGYTQIDLGIAKYHFEIGAGKDNFDWV